MNLTRDKVSVGVEPVVFISTPDLDPTDRRRVACITPLLTVFLEVGGIVPRVFLHFGR